MISFRPKNDVILNNVCSWVKLCFFLHFIFQPLDFENKRTHNVVVEAVNKHVDPRFVDLGSFRDQTIVRVSVSDIDEPPIFQPAEGTIMEVQEDTKVGALVGVVAARDPDVKNKPVRYDREWTQKKEMDAFVDGKAGMASTFMHLI